MRKNRLKEYLFSVLSITFTLGMENVVFAGQWLCDTEGWKYDSGNGIYLTNCWEWIDGNQDGEAECYYFDASGYCLMNTFTPDGSIVDNYGAWIFNGVVQKKYVGKNSNKDSKVIYQPVLEQHRRAINNNFYKGRLYQDFDIKKMAGEYVNEYLLYAARYSDSSELYYAFADIDGNGTEELLIGLYDSKYNFSEPYCFDVFGYNGKQPICFFNEKITERTSFTLYANGIMELEGSGGAAYSWTEFYRMDANGYCSELIEKVTYQGSYNSWERDKYFHESPSMQYTEEISEAEYTQICKKYKIMDKYVLSWVKLSEDGVF